MDILVSVIIVNYNTEDLLIKCIDSVIEKTRNINYEIIVVDNDSRKGSLLNLIEKYTQVQFILLDKNLGFGAANNYGSEIANGRYLFFLNPDTVLLNDAISILYNYISINPLVGICGGNLFDKHLRPAVSYHTLDFYYREYLILFNRKYQIGFNNTEYPLEVNVIMGADLMISKEVFTAIKGFDVSFFMYFEEVYLCNQLQKLGYKIVSVPEAHILHLEGGSSDKKTEKLKKWSYQEHWYSKWVYFRKTKGIFLTNILYCSNKLKSGMAVFYYSIKSNQDKTTYWKLKNEIIKKTYRRKSI